MNRPDPAEQPYTGLEVEADLAAQLAGARLGEARARARAGHAYDLLAQAEQRLAEALAELEQLRTAGAQ